jgi:hypothetical protein
MKTGWEVLGAVGTSVVSMETDIVVGDDYNKIV